MKPELRLNGRVLSAMLPDLPPEAEERLRRQISRLSAQKEETPVKKKLSLGLDNLASVNDLCLLTYTDGLDTDTREKYTRCYTMFMEFPLGYWTFSLMYSRSEYMQHIQGLGAPYKMAGNDGSGVFTIDRLLWRKKLDRVKGRMSLNLKEKETFIQEIKIDAQSDRLSIAEFGLVYNGYLGGGYFYWEACYTRGTRLFKASKDAPGMSADMPRAQFANIKGTSINYPLLTV